MDQKRFFQNDLKKLALYDIYLDKKQFFQNDLKNRCIRRCVDIFEDMGKKRF